MSTFEGVEHLQEIDEDQSELRTMSASLPPNAVQRETLEMDRLFRAGRGSALRRPNITQNMTLALR
jgi:hypothetical protein